MVLLDSSIFLIFCLVFSGFEAGVLKYSIINICLFLLSFLNAQYLCCGDLSSKLGAQVTFLPKKDPLSTTCLLSLLVTPQDEWRLHDPLEGKPDGLNNPERELIQQFPEVWAKDTPPPRPCLGSPNIKLPW